MAAFIAVTFYATMVLAGYAIELIFNLVHLVPAQRNASVIEAHVSWNYTTWLNIAFLILAAVLLARFVISGGLPMLKMMGGSPNDAADHAHHERGGHDAAHHAGPRDRGDHHDHEHVGDGGQATRREPPGH
jgi:uncharacterized protein